MQQDDDGKNDKDDEVPQHPVGITLRSRRRVQKMSSESASQNKGKENKTVATKPASSSKATSSKRRNHKVKPVQNDEIPTYKNEDNDGDYDDEQMKNGKMLFQSVLQRTASFSSHSNIFIQNHPLLADLIFQSSSRSLHSHRSVTASLSLEEHETDLLNDCRTLIKRCNNNDLDDDNDSKLDTLYITVHILRALSSFQYSVKQQESTLKLLYHVATQLSDLGKSLVAPSTTENRVKFLSTVMICLAAFEATGKLLQNYSTPSSPGRNTVFLITKKRTTNDDNILLSPLFPIPMDRTKATPVECGTLTTRKIFALGLQMAMTTLMLLVKVESMSLEGSEFPTFAKSDFGEFPNNLLRDICPSPSSITGQFVSSTNLLHAVILPWIHFFANSIGHECFADMLAYGKRIHQYYWEAATAAASVNDGELALQLRQYSIMGLLLLSPTDKPPLPSQIRIVLADDKLLDVACSFAWKAAASFRTRSTSIETKSTRSPQADALWSFHEQMGPILDDLYADQGDGKSSCLSYVEYCAYRALELGPCHESVRFLAIRKDTPSNVSMDFSVATFDVFLLALSVNRGINDADQDNNNGALISSNPDPDFPQSFLHQFTSTLLKTNEIGILTRCYKIFVLAALPRNVYNWLQQDWKPTSPMACSRLYYAGKILADCMSPLCVKLLKLHHQLQPNSATTFSKEMQRYQETSVECWIRALSAFVQLVDSTCISDEIVTTEIDSIATNLVNLVTGGDDSGVTRPNFPPSCVEKAAKTLSVIGKRFLDQGAPSRALLPLAYSTQLFTRLSSLTAYDNNSLQLSARWFHFACALQLNGMMDEALISFVATLTLLAKESVVGSKKLSVLDLIHFCASLTKGGFVTGQIVVNSPERGSSIISRLISLFWEREESFCDTKAVTESRVNALSVSSAIKMLSTSVLERSRPERIKILEKIESKCGVRFNISGLCRVMLLAVSSDSKTTENLLPFQIKIMTELIVGLGMRYQECRDLGENTEGILDEFQNLLRLAAPLTRKLTSMDNNLLLAFYVSAAHSLHPNYGLGIMARSALEVRFDEGLTKDPSLAVVNRILIKAEDTVKQSEARGLEWVALSAALTVVVSSYRMQLNQLMQCSSTEFYVRHFQLCLDATNALVKVSPSQRTAIYDASKSCLVWELVQFHGRLSFDCRWLAAARISCSIQQLANHSSNGEQQWSRALAISSFLKADTSPLDDVDEHGYFADQARFCSILNEDMWGPLAHSELVSIQMRVRKFKMFGIDLAILVKEAVRMFDRLETGRGTHMLRWVAGSVAETVSELYECLGDVYESVRWIRRYHRICRQSLDGIRKQGDSMVLSSLPLWTQAATATMFVGLSERHLNCLQRISLLYGKLGNHRKSEGYALIAAGNAESGLLRAKTDSIGSLVLSSLSVNLSSNNRELASHRLLVKVKAQAMAHDIISKEIDDLDHRQQQKYKWPCSDEFTQNQLLHVVSSLLVVGDSMYGGPGLPDQTKYREFYQEARNLYDQLAEQFRPGHFPRVNSPDHLVFDFQTTNSNLKLREIRSIIHNSDQRDNAASLCSDVLTSPFSSLDCRAWAFYYLGTIKLEEARQDKSLFHLWAGHSNASFNSSLNLPKKRQGQNALSMARGFFLSCLSYSGITPTLLSRNALRCLALATGPTIDAEQHGVSAATLVQSSLGITSRQSVFRAIVDGSHSRSSAAYESELAAELLYALDTSFVDLDERNRKLKRMYDILQSRLPSNWRSVSMCMCPTGEIILVSSEIEDGLVEVSTVCVFPETNNGGCSHNSTYDDILKPIDEIIERNQLQLRRNELSPNAGQMSESKRRQWWKIRSSLDRELGDQIEHIERTYFSDEPVRKTIFGSQDDSDDSTDLSCGNLADKFEAALNFDSVEQLSDHGAASCSVPSPPKNREVRTLWEGGDMNRMSTSGIVDDGQLESNTKCFFLILDESLHRVPFEGMSCFASRAVCRVPSLPFLVLPIVEASDSRQPTELDPVGVSYILDPESNLSETTSRLLPVINSISSTNRLRWEGVVGCSPSALFMENALTKNNGLVLYCGHGAGQVYYPRKSVERLLSNSAIDDFGEKDTTTTVATRRCRATVILMGCSSGKLVSVNKKGSKSLDNSPIHFEPEGIALSYLNAGSPCVVGNLWDVTDRDIDRYSIALLNAFISNKESPRLSLAQCVADARAACKLRYLVGCAPVNYGIPVRVGNFNKHS